MRDTTHRFFRPTPTHLVSIAAFSVPHTSRCEGLEELPGSPARRHGRKVLPGRPAGDAQDRVTRITYPGLSDQRNSPARSPCNRIQRGRHERIYADFNNIAADGTLPLTCRGSVDSIAGLEEPFRGGEEVCLSDGELQVVARVFCRGDGSWAARSDWAFAPAAASGEGDLL